MKKIILIIISLALLYSTLLAQNSFILDDSIGTVKTEIEETESELFAYIPIKDWQGLRFIFLPKPKSLQKYGYLDFYTKADRYYEASYDEYVGRIIEVIEVEYQNGLWEVMFKTEDTQEVLLAIAYSDSINDIGLVSDIENARNKWAGKVLWINKTKISTYNSDSGEIGSISTKKLSPVKVKNIVAGWDNYSPVRLILETNDGKTGFLDVNVSGTNISKTLKDNFRFKDYFYEVNPRTTYDWKEKVWNAIERESVFVGMTKEQVKISWGEPENINKTIATYGTREQWVYSSNYLYFEENKLTSIQSF